jgi:acetyl-CoA carboxylase biotin carboxyl carrier protein
LNKLYYNHLKEEIILDLSELKGIISLMQKSDLTDLEIETQDLKLRLSRPGGPTSGIAHQSQPNQSLPLQPSVISPPVVPDNEEGVFIFKSPMVGTFYRKPSPDDPSFVSVGQTISKGHVLCIIEAMKVMNEIQSDNAGVIVEILVEDSISVEYGQPLFKIRT